MLRMMDGQTISPATASISTTISVISARTSRWRVLIVVRGAFHAHWKGGVHSELRIHKPRTGEHGYSTPEQALAAARSSANPVESGWISSALNRMGMPSGQGKTWTAHRVGSVRRVRGIHGYRSAEKNGEWLTMRDAAAKLGVSHHQIRKLIKAGILASEQIMPDAPHQIRAADLASEQVVTALKRKGRPCRVDFEKQISMFLDT
jgi:hypothetical protein